jgi:hypothetical protein
MLGSWAIDSTPSEQIKNNTIAMVIPGRLDRGEPGSSRDKLQIPGSVLRTAPE